MQSTGTVTGLTEPQGVGQYGLLLTAHPAIASGAVVPSSRSCQFWFSSTWLMLPVRPCASHEKQMFSHVVSKHPTLLLCYSGQDAMWNAGPSWGAFCTRKVGSQAHVLGFSHSYLSISAKPPNITVWSTKQQKVMELVSEIFICFFPYQWKGQREMWFLGEIK